MRTVATRSFAFLCKHAQNFAVPGSVIFPVLHFPVFVLFCPPFSGPANSAVFSRAVPDLLSGNPAGAGCCRICKANPAGAGAGAGFHHISKF